nr:MAG TPA: hypothetical protein [Caudoviricetes sp.]
MKGYKAFKKGLVCLGKQYAENTVFEEPEALVCHKGMHYCHEPLAVLDYYDLVDENGEIPEFAEVEPLDKEHTDDSAKFCTRKLKIKSKISLAKLVKAQISYVRECAEKSGGNCATLAGGNEAKLAGGDEATLAGGDWAKLAGGDGARLAGGNWAKLAGGCDSVIVGGHGSIAKGKKGALIVLVARDETGSISSFCAKVVDGVTIKEDVFYKLEDGEFKEAAK